jgi:N-acetylneuraminic acid mutarotase
MISSRRRDHMSRILFATRGRLIGLGLIAGAVMALAWIWFGGDHSTLAKDDVPRSAPAGVAPPVTASPTPAACDTYSVATATATIVPGTTDSGNHCDDCVTAISLPFPVHLYDQTFTGANIGSNGDLYFGTGNSGTGSACQPTPGFTYAIFAFPDDLYTLNSGYGVFTSISGTAPNRIFNIEWRAQFFPGTGYVNFEIRLYETQPGFDIIYGTGTSSGTGALVQRDVTCYTSYCNTVYQGLALSFGGPASASPTSATPTTPTATATHIQTATAAATPTCSPQTPPHLPTPVVRAVGAYFPANGKFYIVGGRSSDAPGSEVAHPFEYDPVANAWITSTATYPDNQVSSMACGMLSVSGTPSIYCVGGNAAGATTATARVFRYNPVTEQIDVLAGDDWPGNPGGNTLPGGFAAASNKLYIMGGFHIGVGMTQQTWEFDPTASAGSRWTQKQDYPVARGFIPATAINGMIYTAGGADYLGGTLVDTNNSYSYNPVANAWTTIATIPRPTEETHALNFGGMMWVISGGRVPPNPGPYVDIYDPNTNSWSSGAPFGQRLDFAADSGGGHIWLAGGYYGGTDFIISPPLVACLTPTPTSAPVATASPTATSTTSSQQVTPTGTSIPPTTSTITPIQPTATSCAISFSDVPVGSTFYPYIHCLACLGLVSGYPDGTFRPNNNVTRGQLSKIVSNAAGFNDNQTVQMFEDVPVGSTFFQYIGRLASRGYVGGYPCGPPGELCGPGNLRYFRPNNNATRGQISKIVSNAAGFNDPPIGQQFQDVPEGSTFYTYTFRLATRNVMQGYHCGGPGEPCIPPADLPYFRPNNNATRGQTSKIVANTFFPDCQAP